MFKNGFLMASGLELTQDRGGLRVGIVGEGEEVGEISMMVLVEVAGADISFGRIVGMESLSRVREAMVGRG